MPDQPDNNRGLIVYGQTPPSKEPPKSDEDTYHTSALKDDVPAAAALPTPNATRQLDPNRVANEGLPVRLQFRVRESGALLECSPSAPIVIGRRNSSLPVDIDLGTSDGQELGVSRNHARIEPMSNRLFVRDLNTVNGTFLNGAQINPTQAYELKDGDELKLGRLHLRVYFIYQHNQRK